jgi:hypothetical protein
MATSNTALRITELDFDSIKNNLKDFMRSQSEFQDYDFEGSGMSTLLDVLAYNTHYMSYYLNMVSNEMFLDSAQLRGSVLSHAKMINYIPTSREAPRALINITTTPSNTEDANTTAITLQKYSKFMGESLDGVNYPFVTLNSNTAVKVNGVFNFANVEIRQGKAFTQQYIMTPDNTKRLFNIPSANIDVSTIEVRVQESSTNSDIVMYSKSDNITDLNSNSTVYFIEENDNLTYSLYFGDGVLGKKPKNGNIITCTFVDTVGSQANSIGKFTSVDIISNLYKDNVIVSTVTAAYGGKEKESIEQVRFKAPYAYTTQNRAVTTGDYQNLILKDYPNVESVSVWGGEDNDPVVYGKVYLSLKTNQNYALTNIDKEYIKSSLIANRNMVTVTPEIIDPEFVYIRVAGKVSYDKNLTNLKPVDIEQLVRASIIDYSDMELVGFDSTFRKSKLQAYIESADKSITAVDVSIFLQKRQDLNVISTTKYNIKYNTPLRKGTFLSRLSSYPEIFINDSNGIERKALFEEILDAFTGINSVTISNPGFDYASAPTVTISGDGYGATAVATVSGGRITGVKIINKGFDYTKATVTFGGPGAGAVATAQLENNYGTLRSFYYKDNGEKIALNNEAGSIDYNLGTVTLNSLRTSGSVPNDLYGEDVVTFFVPSATDIVKPLRNRILVIDSADAKSIQIEVVAE